MVTYHQKGDENFFELNFLFPRGQNTQHFRKQNFLRREALSANLSCKNFMRKVN